MRGSSDQSLLLQEFGDDLADRLLVDIDALVHVGHLVGVDDGGQGIELLFQLRILLQHFFAHHRRRLVGGEVALVVFQQLEIETLDAAVRGIRQADIQLLVAQRGVDQAGIHLLDLATVKLEAIQLLHRLKTVRTRSEFIIDAHQLRLAAGLQLLREMSSQIFQGMDALLVGQLLRHGKGIRIVERRFLKPDQADLLIEFLDSCVSRFGVEFFVDVVVDDQRGAGVFPDDIELLAFLRLAHQRRAKAVLELDLIAFGAQVLRRHLRQDQLLGEVLAANHQRGGAGLRCRHQTQHQGQYGHDADESVLFHDAIPFSSYARPRRDKYQLLSRLTMASNSSASKAVAAAPSNSWP